MYNSTTNVNRHLLLALATAMLVIIGLFAASPRIRVFLVDTLTDAGDFVHSRLFFDHQ